MSKWTTALGIILLAIIFAALGNLVAGCANATDDCERVRSAINTKAVWCDAGFEVRGDCDAANYVDGDVEACLRAVEAAACQDLRTVVRTNCLGLFGHGGP